MKKTKGFSRIIKCTYASQTHAIFDVYIQDKGKSTFVANVIVKNTPKLSCHYNMTGYERTAEEYLSIWEACQEQAKWIFSENDESF